MLALLWNVSNGHSKVLPLMCMSAMLHSMLWKVKLDNPLCMPLCIFTLLTLWLPVYFQRDSEKAVHREMFEVLATLWNVWRVSKALKCLTSEQSFGMFEKNVWRVVPVSRARKCWRWWQTFQMCDVLAKPWNVSHVSKALKCFTC